MKKIIVSEHITLDGFLARPNGEMDWIKLDDELFEMVGVFTNTADTALYGRVTYDMMEAYWPTAGDNPDASKHDIEHSTWYNNSDKVVLSKTIKNVNKEKTTIISENAETQLEELKNRGDKNILVFGSPSVVHLLMKHNLIDEYWLFVNPVLLGEGIPLFTSLANRTSLKLLTSKVFDCGVAALNYSIIK